MTNRITARRARRTLGHLDVAALAAALVGPPAVAQVPSVERLPFPGPDYRSQTASVLVSGDGRIVTSTLLRADSAGGGIP